MKDSLFCIEKIAPRPHDGFSLRVHIPSDSFYFQGHYPSNPIVPGIAYLHMVQEGIAQALPEQHPLIWGLRRIRFRRLVTSGGTFECSLTPQGTKPRSPVAFAITHDTDPVCDGIMLTDRDAAPVSPLSSQPLLSKPSHAELAHLWDLIPHRKPMLLVDEVTAMCTGFCETRTMVTAEWPTSTALILLEVVAQSAALLMAWEDRRPGTRTGLLAGIRRAHWSKDHLIPGTVVTTNLQTTMKVEEFASFAAHVQSSCGLTAEILIQGLQV